MAGRLNVVVRQAKPTKRLALPCLQPRKKPISQLPDKIQKIFFVTFLALIWRVYEQNFSSLTLKLREEACIVRLACLALSALTIITSKSVAILRTNLAQPRKNSKSQPTDNISRISSETFLLLTWEVYIQNFSSRLWRFLHFLVYKKCAST